MQPQPIAFADDSGTARRPDRWVFALLLVLLAWLPLPWGSKPDAATALFGFSAAALALVRVLIAPLPHLPRTARFVLVLWLAWLAWCALFAVPLPEALLRVLSPNSDALHAAVAALPGGTALYTLSILPGATIDQAILGANYLCLFWLTLACVAQSRGRQRAVLTVLMLSGVAQALYGSVMTLSGLEYGFLEHKSFGIGWATGTFVNRNHFAGYLELTLAAGVALVLADLRVTASHGWKQRLADFVELALSPRMRTRIMIAVMVIGLVLTRSRMGNVAFFVALALAGNLYVLLRQPKYLLKSLLFFASLFVVDLLIVSENYGLQQVVQRIETTQLETEQRTLALRDLAPVLEQYAVTGAGPGTFGAAFSPVRSADIRHYFDHAHNDYLEFLIETGIVGGVLLGLIALSTLAHGVRVLRNRRDPGAGALAFAGIMGLTALGIHSLADFNLRIPAVAATLVVLMALTLSCSSESSARRRMAAGPAGSDGGEDTQS